MNERIDSRWLRRGMCEAMLRTGSKSVTKYPLWLYLVYTTRAISPFRTTSQVGGTAWPVATAFMLEARSSALVVPAASRPRCSAASAGSSCMSKRRASQSMPVHDNESGGTNQPTGSFPLSGSLAKAGRNRTFFDVSKSSAMGENVARTAIVS